MLVVLPCSLLISFVAGGPIFEETQSSQKLATNYAYALDLSSSPQANILTLSGAQCIRSNGYSTVFVLAYALDPDSHDLSSTFFTNACVNINNVHTAGLGAEVSMWPLLNSFNAKNATQQMDELYNGLKKCNIMVRSIWVGLISIFWNSCDSDGNCTANINFINGINARAAQLGIRVNYFTSHEDWNYITGGASGIANGTGLWYYDNEIRNDEANFNDFVPFGDWSFPTVKDFAISEMVCGYEVNKDVYTTSAFKADMIQNKLGHPVVGRIGIN